MFPCQFVHMVVIVVVVQSLRCAQLFVTPWTAACQASLSITISQSLLKLMSIASVIPPVISSSVSRFSSCPQSFSTVHNRWPKYWSFSFNISPSNEYSGLISFRIDWFDLLDIQGTLKSLLQHHSQKASVFQYSALSMVLLSHLYMTTLKTIASFDQTDLCQQIVSLIFNMLSRFVIAFLPRSKHLNFMVTIIIHSAFEVQESSLSLFPFFPHLFAMKQWAQMLSSQFYES